MLLAENLEKSKKLFKSAKATFRYAVNCKQDSITVGDTSIEVKIKEKWKMDLMLNAGREVTEKYGVGTETVALLLLEFINLDNFTQSSMDATENQAYNDGLDAQTDGAGKDANTHLPGSILHESWEMGWQQGADEDYEEDMNRE